jgi:outer membrane protein OmpA-like peptidoglycan-associated protein
MLQKNQRYPYAYPIKKGHGKGFLLFLSLIALTFWISGCTATVRQPQRLSANQEVLAAFQQRGITAREQGTGVVLIIPYVSFAYKKAELSEQTQDLLRVVATTLNSPPVRQRPIAVDGHTDAAGSMEYNHHLSRERAEAVAQALIAGGVSRERVKVTEYGEAFPIAPNKTPQGKDNPVGRAQNRRVELVILPAQAQFP